MDKTRFSRLDIMWLLPAVKNGEASYFSGRPRLYDGLTLASEGGNGESRRL